MAQSFLPTNVNDFFLSLFSLFSVFFFFCRHLCHLRVNFPLTGTLSTFKAVFEFIWASCVSSGHSNFTVVSYQQQGRKAKQTFCSHNAALNCLHFAPSFLFLYFLSSRSLHLQSYPSLLSPLFVYSVPLTFAVAWAQRVLLLVRWQVHRADTK